MARSKVPAIWGYKQKLNVRSAHAAKGEDMMEATQGQEESMNPLQRGSQQQKESPLPPVAFPP